MDIWETLPCFYYRKMNLTAAIGLADAEPVAIDAREKTSNFTFHVARLFPVKIRAL